MAIKILNTRKKEILDAQEKMLKNAVETKTQLSASDETAFTALTTELDQVNANIARYEAVNKGRVEVATPREQAVISNSTNPVKFYAAGGYRKATPLTNCSEEYVKGFWSSLRSVEDHQKFLIQNAALGEAGTSAAGGALVPIQTDPSESLKNAFAVVLFQTRPSAWP